MTKIYEFMINGEYFANRTVQHINGVIGDAKLGQTRYGNKIRRDLQYDNIIEVFGIRFSFGVIGNELDVKIEYESPGFDDHMENIRTKKFFENPQMKHLKQQRNKYKKSLDSFSITKNGKGDYHMKGRLKTRDRDKAFFAVLNMIVKPVWAFEL